MAKLLWAHPSALHETAGAALNLRVMLEALTKRGIEIRTISAPTFESSPGRALFMKRLGSIIIPPKPFTLKDDPLLTTYVPYASSKYHLQTQEDMSRFFSVFHATLNAFRPDVLMTYVEDCLGMALQSEARLRGMPIVAHVFHNRSTNNKYAMADAVITDSPETASFYRQRGINKIESVGTFIQKEHIIANVHQPYYVTMVNPGTPKGIALTARLALMAEKEWPELRFLWVESWGGPINDVLAGLHSDDNTAHHPLAGRPMPNVDIAAHTADMRPIYSKTALLLAPSLIFESFCRSATEAMMNGSPVLASQSGGLPGNVGEGGQCLMVPQATQQDWLRIPTEAEMRPWFNAMRAMLDPKAYPSWQEKARKAALKHDLAKSTDKMLAVLEPLFAKQAGSHEHFITNSAFC